MKAVTEFASFTLNAALKAKDVLTAEGKSAEDIQASLGTTYKFEGEKLSYFMAALDVATANQTNLKRILVMKLNEGEAPPAKAVTGTEGICYVPEALVEVRKEQPKRDGRGGKGKGGGGREKSSPWGLSPEEKAAKIAARAKSTP